MLIEHKILSVEADGTGMEAFIATLDSGYEIVNSSVLPDGNTRYVLRRMPRNGIYVAPTQEDPFNGQDQSK